MRITAVELENIKSYRHAIVEFTSGLNAVCGLNGSGKTTLLEAIGLALFDFLPYDHKAFFREGQKGGTVRVRLLARDGREYEVVRKVGSPGGYYVADVELGGRLADQKANVLDWIRSQALGIDGEADLKSLFQNAVGVPQGLMTSAFVESANARKAVFDPLLRVEEYQKAWENLRDTVSYLRERTAGVDVEIARLQAEADRIPEVRERAAGIRTRLQECDGRLARLEAELTEVEAQKAELDATLARLQTLQSELAAAQYDVKRFGERLELQQQALDAARGARQAVAASEAGYHLVRAARERLAELDRSRSKRDGLNAAIAKSKGQIDGIKRQIDHLEAELRAAQAAQQEAGNLDPAVARQDDLERQMWEAEQQLRDAGSLDKQLAALGEEIALLERRQTERTERLEKARAARERLGRLPAVQEERRIVSDNLAELRPLREQQKKVEEEGGRLRQNWETLTAEVKQLAELRLQLADAEPEAPSADLRRQHQELRDERAMVLATIEYQNVARVELGRRQCPLLEVECPVVAADGGALSRLDRRVSSLQPRRAELDRELTALEVRVTAAETAEREVQRLQVGIAQLERSEQALGEVDGELQACREQYRALAQALAQEPELRKQEAELRQEEEELRRAEAQAAQIALLEEQVAGEGERLASCRQELTGLEERRAALAAAEEQMQSVTSALVELDDPRARRDEALASARRGPDLETRLERERGALEAETARFQELSAQLQPYEGLDDEIAAQRRIERDHSDAHDLYLQCRAEAAQVEERERAVAETAASLQTARQSEEAAATRCREVAALYDAERHAAVQAQWSDTFGRVKEERENRRHLARELEEAEGELRELQAREKTLLARRGERDELESASRALGFIRETVKAAGPAVTETLLTHISQIANDIFAEIMDDHAAELRWDRDYEVLVQRGPETRTFAQLSGGEQMSAALAVRLALLKEMSDVDFAFFDEPTQNMDAERRGNLAEQISEVRGFDQLIVISHDDTFETHTDNLIRLHKAGEETQLEAG